MMEANIDIGTNVTGNLKEATWEGVQRAAVMFWSAVQQKLNVSNPRPYTTPSRPGEPPRKRTGNLQRGVVYQLDEANHRGRVGMMPAAYYGTFLELGTARMLPRPFLLETLREMLPQLQKVLKGE